MSSEKMLTYESREVWILNGDLKRLFWKFALPGVGGLLFIGLQSVVDGLVLGHFVGANALASVNLILPCYSLITAVAIMIGIGCQTLVSISLGEGDRRKANDAVASSFYFLLGLSAVLSALIYAFAVPIAGLLGANEVLLPGAVDYIRTLVPFFPVLCAMFFGDYIIKAMGRPLYAMSVMGMTVLLNIVLAIWLVGGLGMGVKGAGLSTGLAFSVGACCNLPYLFYPGCPVSVPRGRFRWRLIWKAFYNGSSEGFSELSVAITVFIFNITLMAYLGEDGVAGFTAINYIMFIGVTLFLGISDGIIPLIGYNFGAGRHERIRKVLGIAVRINMGIGLTLFLVLFLFGRTIMSFFFPAGGAALAVASEGIAIYSFAFLMNGLNILASSYFTAIGNAKVSIIISMLRGLVFVVAGILIYPHLWGIRSIWLNVPIAEVCTLGVSGWLVWKSLRKSRRKSVRK